jgi:flagellar secretion chaperone FliS
MYGGMTTRKYMQVNIQTASRGQILLALYETAIRYAKMGAASIRSGNVAAKGRELQRVTAIVSELAATLDRAVAPDLCDSLERLYFYMQDRLAHANAMMDPEAAEEVARLLDTLREAWAQAVEQVEGSRAPRAAAAGGR